MRILLVDDEAELVSTLAERLSFRGIEADWVTRSGDALKKIYEQKYDIAVLDVKMPGMSGIDLAREIHQYRTDIKIIFVTGHGSHDDFQEGSSESEKEFYLAKPINIDVLIKKMKEIMEY